MKIEKVKRSKCIEVEEDTYVCSDGKMFHINHKSQAEEYEKKLQRRYNAERNLKFVDTNNYELVYAKNREDLVVYYSNPSTDVHVSSFTEPKWFVVEFEYNNHTRDSYEFTPLQEILDEFEEIKKLTKEALEG